MPRKPRKWSRAQLAAHAAHEREKRAAQALAAGRPVGISPRALPMELDAPCKPRVAPIASRPELGELPAEHWPELRRVVEYRLFSLQKYRRSLTVRNNRCSLRYALAELPERPTPDDILRWMVALNDPPPKGAGLMASTVNRYRDHVYAAYEWCRKRGLYSANPCAGLPELREPEDVDDRAPGALGGPQGAVEIYERLRAVLDAEERVALSLLRFCGLTNEEIFGLDQSDFDPRTVTLLIRRGQRAGLESSAKELKTRNRRRSFQLPEFVPDRELRELIAYLRTPRQKARAYGKREPGGKASYEPTTRIFPWSSYRLDRFTDKLRATAPEMFGPLGQNDKRHRPLHLWRHAFAETAADVLKTTDPSRMLLKLQKLMGHGSISSTEKYLRKRRGLGLWPGEAEGMRDALATGRIPGAQPVPLVALPLGSYSVDAERPRRKGGAKGSGSQGSQRTKGDSNPG